MGFRSEDYILIVLNGDDRIRGGGYGNGGYRGRVAGNGSGIFGNRAADGGAGYGLGFSDFHSVPEIAHGVVGHIQLEPGGEGGIGIHTVGGFIQVGLYGGQIQRCVTGYQGFALVPAHELVIGVRGGSAADEAGIHGVANSGQGVGIVGHTAVGFSRIVDGNGLHRPHGVERIVALVIHDDGTAGLIFRGSRGGVLAPAHEGIAGAGEAKGRVALQQDGLVILIAFGRNTAAAAVGVIGQSSRAGLIAPDGVEGDVGVMDGNLVAGLIDGAAAYLGTPTQEHLALGGSQVGSGHDIRVGTVGIGLVVHRCGAGAVGGIISNGEGQVAGVVGIEGNIAVNQGVEVEGGVDVVGSSSAPHSPASPGVARGNVDLGEVILVDLGAVRNGNGLGIAAGHGQIGSSHKLRRGPLGVDGDTLGRHGAGEHILLALPQLIIVPAHELILRGDARRTGGGVGHIGDVRLVLLGDRVHYRAIIDKLNLVAVAVVVELSAVVTATVLRTVIFISGKAGDVIEVLSPGNAGTSHHYRVGMVQLIRFPVNNSTLLAIQNLDIVAGAGGTAAFTFGNIEVAAVKRHHIDTCLVGATSVGAFRPVGTAVAAAGPLIADVSTILSSDGKERVAAAGGLIAGAVVGVLFSTANRRAQVIATLCMVPVTDTKAVTSPPVAPVPPAVGMLFLAADGGCGTAAAVGGPEVDGVHVPVVFHIDDCASVTRDGLLLNLLDSEAVVRLGNGCCQATGSAGQGFGFLKGELIIVHILQPVNHGVLGIGIALPVSGEGHALRQAAAEGELGIPIVPALEGIANPGGSGGFHGIGVGAHEHGGDVGAAVGIIGDPVARLYLGVKGHIGAVNGDGVHPVGKAGLSIPAGDGLVGIHGEGNIGGNHRAIGSLLGGADCRYFRIVHEEHVVHKLELGIIVPCGGSGNGSGSRGEGAAVLPAHPAGELEAILLGRGGSVDVASVGHILGVLQFPVHIEVVGGNRRRGVLNIVGIHALHGAVENLHVVGAVRLGAGEGRGIVAAAVAQEGLVLQDLDIALHSGDGEGEFLGLLIGGEGHGIVSLAGLELTAQSREVHVHGQGDSALLRGIGGLGGGFGSLGGLPGGIRLCRGVVYVDGLGSIGVGAGENLLVLAVGPQGHVDGEGVALHCGDTGHEGLGGLVAGEHQILVGDGMAGFPIGVDSTKHHSQLHAGLRFAGLTGSRGRSGLTGIRGPAGIRGRSGPAGIRGRGRIWGGGYGGRFHSGSALRLLGGCRGSGFRGLPGVIAAACQQPAGRIQHAGGQHDGDGHDQGQDTGM